MRYIAIILVLLFAGCDPPIPSKKFVTREISIICVDEANMAAMLAERVPYDPFAPYCNSYYDAFKGIIYVSWSKNKDINGKPMPNFEDLGHEMWHVASGWWHGGSVFSPPDTNATIQAIKVSTTKLKPDRDEL
ncbi:MAG: hypothetical protein WCI03_10690 [bacterium]